MNGSVFVSSSGDLRELRERLHKDLQAWLQQHGLDHLVKPYLWEEDKEDGRLLSDRLPIQAQLPDPASPEVVLTICLFGERCGSPLQDELPPHVRRRFDGWWAQGDGPGLLHPWPSNQEAQDRGLDKGQYPLTGTVYELISAHAQPEDADNLIVAYCADRPVAQETKVENIVLNGKKLFNRLTDNRSDSETQAIKTEIYAPQTHALLNLLKQHNKKKIFARHYRTEDEMCREVLEIAQNKLRKKFGIASLRNPFKESLIHWSIDDEKLLPGRGDNIRKAVDAILGDASFLLLTGRSGCGKSSLLQSGIMRTLRDQKGYIAVAFRPNELMADPDGPDALDRLATHIAQTAQLPFSIGGPRAMRPTNYADSLRKALEGRGVYLAVGLDQFEEIIDELKLEKQRNIDAPPKGWWLVIQFLSYLCKSSHVRLVATLESARENAFRDLGIERVIGLACRTQNADVTDDMIGQIAQNGFASGGLPLAPDLIEAIKKKWREFEKQPSDNRASPLPLACLFFHQLYERFADQAAATAAERVGNSFNHAGSSDSDRLLTLEYVGGEDEIDFDKEIQKLADDAWREGGGDPNFRESIENDADFSGLNNFLKTLVAVDHDGTIQLRAPLEDDADVSTLRMRRAFRSHRLLVSLPGEHQLRVQLSHQALVDQWPPAKRWYAYRRQSLQIVQGFREDVRYWSKREKPISIQEDGSTLHAAALALDEYVLDWQIRRDETQASTDIDLREAALKIFDTATDPLARIAGSTRGKTYAHIAAIYHRIDLLRTFVETTPDCLKVEDDLGTNLLFSAAWSDGPAVPFLISNGVSMWTEKVSWCAIAAPISEKLIANFDTMVLHLDVDAPIHKTKKIRMVHYAAQFGNLHAIEYLKKHGAALDAVEINDRTALFYTAFYDQADAFRSLLGHIDIRQQDSQGNTAISLASACGSEHVLSAYVAEEEDAERLEDMLRHRNSQGETPLMIAARHRQTNALRALMSLELRELGDPSAQAHRRSNGDTLFHLVLRGFDYEKVSDTDRFRARAVVELLLQDGRLDPYSKNNDGETPFDIETKFQEALRVLREDDRVPRVYTEMSAAMRIADLSSKKVSIVMRLLNETPEALTDVHQRQDSRHLQRSIGDPHIEPSGDQGATGLDILVRRKNHLVLSKLADSEIHWPVLKSNFQKLLALAALSDAGRLRATLSHRFERRQIEAYQAGELLGACLDANDLQTARMLSELGAPVTFRRNDRDTTVLHFAAVGGDTEFFRSTLDLGRFSLPRDEWGRQPSDLAAEALAETFRDMESKMDVEADEIAARTIASFGTGRPPYLVLECDSEASPAAPQSILALEREWNQQWGNIEAYAVRVFDLPFQPDVRLADVRPLKVSERAGRLCFLLHGDGLHRLDGTSPPIHTVNGKQKPLINEQTVLQYLAFFCFFVRGEEGPFLIVDRPEHPFLPDLGSKGDAFVNAFRPPRVWGQNDKGEWLASGLVYYSKALFFADFVVQPDGMIRMESDTQVLADLPSSIDAPLDIRIMN